MGSPKLPWFHSIESFPRQQARYNWKAIKNLPIKPCRRKHKYKEYRQKQGAETANPNLKLLFLYQRKMNIMENIRENNDDLGKLHH